MSSRTVRETIVGPAGTLECAVDSPEGLVRGVAIVCHPHPQHGGTMDNKVVSALVRAFLLLGYRAVRFNFRGVGASEGKWSGGDGEIDDALAVVAATRDASMPLVLAGFSFGAFVASQAAFRLKGDVDVQRLVLVGPSTQKQQMPAVAQDTLVIHGEMDDVVPLSATLDWARPQVLPVVVIPGAGHFFHGHLTLLKDLVVRSWHP